MSDNKEVVVKNSGLNIGLAGILTIIFVIAKIGGFITWSWWWVFSPILISTGLGILILIICFILLVLMGIFSE